MQELGLWRASGMGGQRLDRPELRRRLSDNCPGWIVDDLADRFEAAFLAFQSKVAAAKRKRRTETADPPASPRMGRRGPCPDDGEPE